MFFKRTDWSVICVSAASPTLCEFPYSNMGLNHFKTFSCGTLGRCDPAPWRRSENKLTSGSSLAFVRSPLPLNVIAQELRNCFGVVPLFKKKKKEALCADLQCFVCSFLFFLFALLFISVRFTEMTSRCNGCPPQSCSVPSTRSVFRCQFLSPVPVSFAQERFKRW